MTTISWDKTGERSYELGLDRGVYYPVSGPGVPWNGLVSVKQDTDGGEVTSYYIDGIKHLDTVGGEDYKATLTAFAAPAAFLESGGERSVLPGLIVDHQPRYTFGLSYRTKLGNDSAGQDAAYVIHLVYNCTAAPIDKAYATLSDKNSAMTFDWAITAVPVKPVGYKPTAHFAFRSDLLSAGSLAALEGMLYGTSTMAASLPEINTLIQFLLRNDSLITEPITEPI